MKASLKKRDGKLPHPYGLSPLFFGTVFIAAAGVGVETGTTAETLEPSATGGKSVGEVPAWSGGVGNTGSARLTSRVGSNVLAGTALGAGVCTASTVGGGVGDAASGVPSTSAGGAVRSVGAGGGFTGMARATGIGVITAIGVETGIGVATAIAGAGVLAGSVEIAGDSDGDDASCLSVVSPTFTRSNVMTKWIANTTKAISTAKTMTGRIVRSRRGEK